MAVILIGIACFAAGFAVGKFKYKPKTGVAYPGDEKNPPDARP